MSRASNQPRPAQTRSDINAALSSQQIMIPSTGIQDPTCAVRQHSDGTDATAPGKIILCGEHAVVYSRPAIALPLVDVRARAVVRDGAAGSGITIDAPDLEHRWTVAGTPDHPLSEVVVNVLRYLAHTQPGATPKIPLHSAAWGQGIDERIHLPDLLVEITSSIPVAGGMGSGAAVATALTRALAGHLGQQLPADQISALVYASERRFHGTPSGIDNTVIAYEQPIWFVRRSPPGQAPSTQSLELEERQSSLYSDPSIAATATMEPITIAAPFTLLIDDPPLPGGCPVLNTAIEADDTNPPLRDRARQVMDEWQALIIRVARKGIRTGELRPDTDPEALATVLTAALEGAVMLSKLYGDPIHMRRAADHLTAHVRLLLI